MNYFKNGALCDLYIGKGAGKMLLRDIRNATQSVKILSPYLSPSFISELIELKRRGVHVELITTDNLEDFKHKPEKNIHNLITQQCHVDVKAVARRRRLWRNMYMFRIL